MLLLAGSLLFIELLEETVNSNKCVCLCEALDGGEIRREIGQGRTDRRPMRVECTSLVQHESAREHERERESADRGRRRTGRAAACCCCAARRERARRKRKLPMRGCQCTRAHLYASATQPCANLRVLRSPTGQ